MTLTHPLVWLNIEPYTFVKLFPRNLTPPPLRYLILEWPVICIFSKSRNNFCKLLYSKLFVFTSPAVLTKKINRISPLVIDYGDLPCPINNCSTSHTCDSKQLVHPDLPTVPLLAGQSRFFTRCPAKSWKCPAFCTKSDFFLQFVTLPRCPDVNANHTFERNLGNSVRFLAKIPNGTAAESLCYSVLWNAIDFCRLYTSKKISMWALPTVPLFAGKSRFFTRNVPLKTFSRLAGLFTTTSDHLFS